MMTLEKSPKLSSVTADHIKEFSKTWKEPAWALELRLKAFENYQNLPWPTVKDEKWKRTNLKALKWEDLSFDASSPPAPPPCLEHEGVDWLSFSDALNKKGEPIKKAWTRAVDQAKTNKFRSLTLALGHGGSCIYISKNHQIKTQLHQTVKGFTLNFVFLEDGAEGQIWEELMGEASSFVSSYTFVHLGAQAQTSFIHLQNWDPKVIHFQFQDISQEADSRFNTVAVAMGGHIIRNESTINLNGRGAENKVLSVLFGDQKQQFENWVTQNHTAQKTTSDIQQRSVLQGKSNSFFSGMISIVKEAQQSDAYQSAKSLLLSKEAKAEAIPNLEILADDVKCSHGAAVGPVDEDQKFYLQTRGIAPKEAEKIIIQGFFEPVIAAVPSEPAQDRLRTFIEEKMARS